MTVERRTRSVHIASGVQVLRCRRARASPGILNPAQVLAYRLKRTNELAVVDLDESYALTSRPTVFSRRSLPGNVTGLYDPRLFVHGAELYVLLHGSRRKDADGKQPPGRQYLARLKRRPVAAALAGSTSGPGPGGSTEHGTAAGIAGYRLVQLRELQLPDDIWPQSLALPSNMRGRHEEKNWVPFIYEDSIHFVYCINPPVVVRVPTEVAALNASDPIRTEFVSAADNATARWRYGDMRGGTPAVYDAALGGYVAFFHSQITFREATPTGPRPVRSYLMGCYVFAAQPPFGIQLISERPLVGPDFYNESLVNARNWRIVFPAGVMVLADSILVSYGRNDTMTRVVRFDRRKLIQSLQPPLPSSWKGAPC